MPKSRLFKALLLSCSLCAFLPQQALAKHPKTCVVLSGGGALGLAHIGVLKVLEEARIPIDCITGTSMGAIVGGLYAVGYKADEIAEIASTINWHEVITGDTPKKYYTTRQKKQQRDHLLNYSLNINNKNELFFPEGLLSTNQLGLTFSEFTWRGFFIEDFSKLPIPFAAVATDIENGQTVVLNHGRLHKAIKASMSFPGFFPPVRLNGRWLVDGAAVNNLPIDVAKSMGADVIIASQLPIKFKKAEELNSPLETVGQLTALLVQHNEDLNRKLLTRKDVLISVDRNGIGFADFDQSEKLIQQGKAAAKKQLAKLKRYALNKKDYQAFRDKQLRNPPPTPVIDYIELNNTSILNNDVILKNIDTKLGQPLDMKVLREDLFRLESLGYFQNIHMDLLKDGEKIGLLIDVTPNTKLKRDSEDNSTLFNNTINLSLDVANDFDGETYVTGGMTWNKKLLNSYGGTFNLDLKFGDTILAHPSFTQPLTKDQSWLLEPSLHYESTRYPIYVDHRQSAEIQTMKLKAGLFLSYLPTRSIELGLGLEKGVGYHDLKAGVSNFDLGGYDIGHYQARFIYDTFDNSHYPTSGTKNTITYSVSSDSLNAPSYRQLTSDLNFALPLFNNTLVLSSQAGISYGNEFPFERSFITGGFLAGSGLKPDEIFTNNYLLHRIMFYRKLNDASAKLINYPIIIGASFELLGNWQDRALVTFSPKDYMKAGALFIASKTLFGPVTLAYGRTEDEEDAVYLMIGQVF